MPIPDFLPDIVVVFWTRLCAWFSSQVYAVMLAHEIGRASCRERV